MRVVFIDDGVNINFIQADKNCVRIKGSYTVVNDNVVPNEENCIEITHSSICTRIFTEEVKSSCDIFFIKILDKRTLRGSIHSLAVALEWCLLNHIDVINLSLGTTNIKEAGLLQEIVEKLVRNHVVIIAASSNNNYLTYPAAFKNIIGVKALNSANMDYPSDCFICGVPHREYSYNEKYVRTESYNSFAAPVITAKVCDCISNGIKDVDDIKKYLLRNNVAYTYKTSKYLKNIKPTMLLDFDKKDNHIEDVLYTLEFFSDKGFYGICLSDSLLSDLAHGIVNIWDVELDIEDVRKRLSYLTSYVDGDFIIWLMDKNEIGKTNLSTVDIIIDEAVTEETLNKILKELT